MGLNKSTCATVLHEVIWKRVLYPERVNENTSKSIQDDRQTMFVNRTDAVSRIAPTNSKYKSHCCVYGAYMVVHPGGYRRRMSRPGRYLRAQNKV